jgi:endonuclease YncB( thermonuclease family)
MPALAVGSFIGLIVTIFGWSLFNKIAPSNPNNIVGSPTNEIYQASIMPAIAEANIPTSSSKPMQKYRVVPKAISGNQVALNIEGKPTTVLLCGLNAPTPTSPYFAKATSHLQKLLDQTGVDNLMLTAITNDEGVAIVELYNQQDHISLNAQQAASGYAFSSHVLAKPCRDHNQIVSSSDQANTNKKGLWAN